MKAPMTEVIAVRSLSWEGEPCGEVTVSIGKPAKASDGDGEFYCPIRTVGLGTDEIETAIFGIDAFQALSWLCDLSGGGWRTSTRKMMVVCVGSIKRCRKSGRIKSNSWQ